MNVQKMVPFSHSKWFLFELSPSALAALPDIFMTTLCPSWALRLSRICLTCTPCKSCCEARLLTEKLFKCLVSSILTDALMFMTVILFVAMCVSGCCVGPAWCRTSPSLRGLITLRVCEWTWMQHLFLLVLLCVSEVTDQAFHFQDPVGNQDIVHPHWSLWRSQVAPDAVRDFSFPVTCSST